jgi:glycosyltransferase involved in cell wall biosynthesis
MTGTLQVLIPNFNRQECLLTVLGKLRPQWHGQFEVVILDDQSRIDPATAIFSQISEARNWVQIIRHPVRVGLAANITFCFVHSTADWMWLLGNDDEVLPNAISTIEQTLAEHPETAFVNFCSNLVARQVTSQATGLDELLRLVDSYPNLNFISTGLYKIARFRPYIATGFHSGYTFSPHLAMLFSLLRDHPDETAILSVGRICNHKPAADLRERWSHVDFAYGAAAMLEMQGLTFEQRRRLAELLVQSAKVHEFLTISLLDEARKESSGQPSRFILESISQRYFYFDRSLLRRLKTHLYPLLFLFPQLSWWLLRAVFKMLGKEDGLDKYAQAPRQGSWR